MSETPAGGSHFSKSRYGSYAGFGKRAATSAGRQPGYANRGWRRGKIQRSRNPSLPIICVPVAAQIVTDRPGYSSGYGAPGRQSAQRDEKRKTGLPAPRPFRKACPCLNQCVGDSLKIADTAPCGSAITAILPTPSTLIGGTKNVAPSSLALAAEASTSAT
jgi:hypothetical protein